MLIDTLKTKKLLTDTYGFTEEHAEGIVRAISQGEERVATKQDLEPLATKESVRLLRKDMETLGETLRKEMREETRKVYGAVALATTVLGLLMTLYEFIA